MDDQVDLRYLPADPFGEELPLCLRWHPPGVRKHQQMVGSHTAFLIPFARKTTPADFTGDATPVKIDGDRRYFFDYFPGYPLKVSLLGMCKSWGRVYFHDISLLSYPYQAAFISHRTAGSGTANWTEWAGYSIPGRDILERKGPFSGIFYAAGEAYARETVLSPSPRFRHSAH